MPRVWEAAGESPEARTTYYIFSVASPLARSAARVQLTAICPLRGVAVSLPSLGGVGPKTIVSDAVIETLPGGSPCQVKIALVPSRLAPAVETVVMEGAQWHLTLTASRLRERLRRACRWNW